VIVSLYEGRSAANVHLFISASSDVSSEDANTHVRIRDSPTRIRCLLIIKTPLPTAHGWELDIVAVYTCEFGRFDSDSVVRLFIFSGCAKSVRGI